MARQLEENGIKLRAPEPEDLDCMFRFENIVDLWDISNTTGPYSRFHLKQYIEQTQNDLFTDRQLRLMIENSDRQVVGIVLFPLLGYPSAVCICRHRKQTLPQAIYYLRLSRVCTIKRLDAYRQKLSGCDNAPKNKFLVKHRILRITCPNSISTS